MEAIRVAKDLGQSTGKSVGNYPVWDGSPDTFDGWQKGFKRVARDHFLGDKALYSQCEQLLPSLSKHVRDSFDTQLRNEGGKPGLFPIIWATAWTCDNKPLL